MTVPAARGAEPETVLVARCQAGDHAAWSELVELYSRYVCAILVNAFRFDDAEAQDTFQEVFARIYQRLGALRDPSALRPWIGQLTRRIAVDRIRARRPEDGLDTLPEQGHVDVALEELIDAMAVRQELAALPEPCAEMLDRFYARDESYHAIAQALGIATGTVSSRMARCLEKLRAALEPAGFGPVSGAHGGR